MLKTGFPRSRVLKLRVGLVRSQLQHATAAGTATEREEKAASAHLQPANSTQGSLLREPAATAEDEEVE